ncbi:unnamed protein product, partial [Tuber aestivum]
AVVFLHFLVGLNCPLDLTTLSPCAVVTAVNHDDHAAIHRLINDISGEIPGASPSRCWHYLDGSAVHNSPPTRSKKTGFLRREPGRTWRSACPTKQPLDRHNEVKASQYTRGLPNSRV